MLHKPKRFRGRPTVKVQRRAAFKQARIRVDQRKRRLARMRTDVHDLTP